MSKTTSARPAFSGDRSDPQKIVAVIAPQKDELIIEIGAGNGALTFPLAERAGQVIAIEKDPALIPGSSGKTKPDNSSILEQDVSKLIFGKSPAATRPIGAASRSSATCPIPFPRPSCSRSSKTRSSSRGCVFLLQKEVAERHRGRARLQEICPPVHPLPDRISRSASASRGARRFLSAAPGRLGPGIARKRDTAALRDQRSKTVSGDFSGLLSPGAERPFVNNLETLWRSPPARIKDAFTGSRSSQTSAPEQLAIGQFARLLRLLHDSGAATVMRMRCIRVFKFCAYRSNCRLRFQGTDPGLWYKINRP